MTTTPDPIRALAEATDEWHRSPWRTDGSSVMTTCIHEGKEDKHYGVDFGAEGYEEDMAAYIAALDPQTVLAILDERDALRAALPEDPWVASDDGERWCYACDHEDTSAGPVGPVHEPDCPWLLARAASPEQGL